MQHAPLLYVLWDITDSVVQLVAAVSLVVIARTLARRPSRITRERIINF